MIANPRLLVVCLCLAAPSLFAMDITVPNFSFELPVQVSGGNDNGGNGTNDTTAIQDWTITAANTNNGVYFPSSGFTTTNPLPAPADGNQVAFVTPAIGDSASITTTNSLGLIQASTTYKLTVALGSRSDAVSFTTGVYTIDVLANGVSVAENTLSGSTIPVGTFTDLSATFTSPVSGGVDGESLTIMITAMANSGSDQGIFDNVRLTADAVPEPGTTALLLGGGAVALLLGRRAVKANTAG